MTKKKTVKKVVTNVKNVTKKASSNMNKKTDYNTTWDDGYDDYGNYDNYDNHDDYDDYVDNCTNNDINNFIKSSKNHDGSHLTYDDGYNDGYEDGYRDNLYITRYSKSGTTNKNNKKFATLNKKVLYLAYGSNLSFKQMKQRCPSAKLAGLAHIENYKLSFRRSASGFYTSIDVSTNDIVPVGVWEVSQADIKTLDIYEGCPSHYKKFTSDFVWDKVYMTEYKNTSDGIVYILPESRQLGLPSTEYFARLVAGYNDMKLDKNFLSQAVHDTTDEINKYADYMLLKHIK